MIGDRLVAALESAPALGGVAQRVRPAAARLTGVPVLRDVLSGRGWLGHPAHPAFVGGPLGLWSASLLLDAARAASGTRASSPAGAAGASAARTLTGAGVLAALPAAASGAHDWVDTDEGEQRLGVAHGLVNAGATTLFALSWWQRRQGRHGLGSVLGAAGGALLAVGGYLGGDLAYRLGVGVNTVAFQSGPTEWRPLVAVADLRPGEPHGVLVDGVALVAVAGATGDAPGGDGADGIAVLENRCTHRGGPLHQGTVAGGCIECPWHLSRFRLLDGSVAQGPASVPQPAYETRVRDGLVEVRREEPGALRRNILPDEHALPTATS